MKELEKNELMAIDGGFFLWAIFETNGHWWMYALAVLAMAAVVLV